MAAYCSTFQAVDPVPIVPDDCRGDPRRRHGRNGDRRIPRPAPGGRGPRRKRWPPRHRPTRRRCPSRWQRATAPPPSSTCAACRMCARSSTWRSRMRDGRTFAQLGAGASIRGKTLDLTQAERTRPAERGPRFAEHADRAWRRDDRRARAAGRHHRPAGRSLCDAGVDAAGRARSPSLAGCWWRRS